MDTTTSLIKQLRAAGLSQSQISRRSGIPQPRLSRWEGGATPTGADDALKLAQLAREVLEPRPAQPESPEGSPDAWPPGGATSAIACGREGKVA